MRTMDKFQTSSTSGKKEDFSTLFPSIDVSWSQGCSTSNLRPYFDLTLTFKLHTVSSI